MTETRANTYSNNNTYGGRIYSSDFDTSYSNGNMAERIEADLKFDEQCKKNTITRDMKGENKNA